MMKLFPKKSKKGITLVESVLAVVILATLAIGTISLLTAGGVKIHEISSESGAYSEAVQKMDLVISSISNGSSEFVKTRTENEIEVVYLDVEAIKTKLGVQVTAVHELYDSSEPARAINLRGWYLTLTHNGATVTAFAANSEGVFDT